MRVRKHRADPHPQDLRKDRSPLQVGAHRPHRQVLRSAVGEGRGTPEKRPLPRCLRARCLPGGLPEDDRLRAAAGERPPMIREKQFPRRLRTRCFSGLPEDDWFRFAAGETSPGAAKPAVPAQLGGSPGDPRKRPFSRCCGQDAPQLSRKRPKVCVIIRQGAADPCFAALVVCIIPGRWCACFRSAATPEL